MDDYIPDKYELYGYGEDEMDELEEDYERGHEPEMTQEEFSSILEGYQNEIDSLKAALAAVCVYYGQDDHRKDSTLARLVSTLMERGMIFVADPYWSGR